MRNIFLLLLFALSNCYSQSQSNYDGFENVVHNSGITALQGKWRINELITSAKTKEYVLNPKNPDGYSYGNNISLNADQTFISNYSADCGNDCFTTTTGKYKIIDQNYICFYLEKITRSGDCSGNSQPNEDLGLYYYFKVKNYYRLLKSSGNLEQDKKNVLYSDLVFAKNEEINQFDENSYINFQNRWEQTKSKDDKDIVAFCMAENQIKDYEILSSYYQDRFRLRVIFLVKVKDEFRYVLYDTSDKPFVSLYDDSQIKEIDKIVNKIDNDKSLSKNVKKTNIPGNTSSENKIITVYKKKGEINKVIYAAYFKYGEQTSISITTIYLQNSKPLYINYQISPDQNKHISETGLYALDWENNKGASKTIKNEIGKKHKFLPTEKPRISKIMEETTTKN